MCFQRNSDAGHLTNELVDAMNAAIAAFAEKQLYLNDEMSLKEMYAVKSKARMGHGALTESIELINNLIKAKLEKEGPKSSEYESMMRCVENDEVVFHKRQTSLLNLSKTDYCMFCKDFHTKIVRHLERHHCIETQVSEYMVLKSTNPVRFRAMRRKFIGEMNRSFDSSLDRNMAMLSANRKKLRMRTLPCSYCHHEYAETRLSRHMNQCKAKELVPLEKRIEKGKRSFMSSGRFDLFSEVRDPDARSVLSKMTDDSVTELVRTDEVLTRYLEYQCRRYTHLKFFRTIVQKVRNMGSFLLHCIESEKFSTFSEILDPLRFQDVYNMILSFAGAGSEQDFNLRYPSKTKSTSENLKEIAHREELHVAGVDKEREESLKVFQKKMEGDFHILSRMAREALKLRKFNKTLMFPLFTELKQLSLYLDNIIRSIEAKSESVADYKRLTNALLAKIILFNRKRPKEVSELKWVTFDNALLSHTLPPNPDLYTNLDEVSKFLVKSMFRMEFVGKRALKTAALLTPDMLAGMKKLRAMKSKFVNARQTYIFARPGLSAQPYNGGQALVEAARDSGVAEPKKFLTTGLRKHLATMSQAVHMTEHMQEDLAVFMQHRLDIHKDIYTLPQGDVQKYKITKCLWQLNYGSDEQLKNLRFNEVGGDADDVIEYEESGEENEGWCNKN